MPISRESIVLPPGFYRCYNCVLEIQPHKLFIMKLNILSSIHSRWGFLQIVMITERISFVSLFIVHTQILLYGNYKRHKGESREATYYQ